MLKEGQDVSVYWEQSFSLRRWKVLKVDNGDDVTVCPCLMLSTCVLWLNDTYIYIIYIERGAI